jgi:hypothetical protein
MPGKEIKGRSKIATYRYGGRAGFQSEKSSGKSKTLVADLSKNDIKLINYGKKHGLTTPTEIRETVGSGFNKKKPPTNDEIKGVIKGTIKKPTGIFAAKGGKV